MKISIFVIFLVFLIPLLNGFDVAENGAERSLSRQKRSLFYPQYTVLQVYETHCKKNLKKTFLELLFLL